MTPPSSVYTGVPFTVSLTAQDAYGNNINSYNQPVSLTASDGEALTPPAAASPKITWSNGVGTSNSLWLENATALQINAVAGSVKGAGNVSVLDAISSLSTITGYAPGYSTQYQNTGSSVTINGHGFHQGDYVLFGNPGTTTPGSVLSIANTPINGEPVGVVGVVNASGTAITVTVPRSAITGPVLVVDPIYGMFSQSTQTFTVNDFRKCTFRENLTCALE